ncbi:hypothetical protein HY227_00825 [Candidatus Wolfebacteria bacterium]|nr:hypothetical protein [Candidatus Wolfebacteria bacterium]
MKEELKALWKILRIFCYLFTVCGVLTLVAVKGCQIPLTESNGTTLVLADEKAQVATAKAISSAIGGPIYELDTQDVKRFLLNDGASVDWIAKPFFTPLYSVTSLKQVNLGIFSRMSPGETADNIRRSLVGDGYEVQLITRPDPAFPDGAVILILSTAFKNKEGSGFGIIVRKNALRVGGPRPTFWNTSWPSKNWSGGCM